MVANGQTAKEVHLGYDRKDADEKDTTPKPAAKGTAAPTGDKGKDTAADTAKKDSKTAAKTATKAGTGKKDEEDDDDEEFPGKVKRVDPTKRLLVITLLNGKDRSYLLSKDVKILVKGTASKQGLQDPMLKPGIPVAIITEAGGRKVKEVEGGPCPRGQRQESRITECRPGHAEPVGNQGQPGLAAVSVFHFVGIYFMLLPRKVAIERSKMQWENA